MKSIYYFVPECPSCGSFCTGRYVHKPLSRMDVILLEKNSLEHGEIVKPVEVVPYENAYCLDCGHEWHVETFARLMTAEEIREEKKKRDTAFFQEAVDSKYHEELENNANKNKKGLLRSLLGI